jgi:hypothetical protein
MPPDKENRPTGQRGGSQRTTAKQSIAGIVAASSDVPAQIRRRRAAADRLPPLEGDNRRDPLDPDTPFRCVECRRDVRLKPYIRLTAQSVLRKPCFKASGGVPR